MTSPVPEPDELQRQIGEAISEVLRRNMAQMTVRWVALAEVMDGDGQRGLWTFTSDELRSWESIGMLQYALHREHAEIVVTELHTDD